MKKQEDTFRADFDGKNLIAEIAEKIRGERWIKTKG